MTEYQIIDEDSECVCCGYVPVALAEIELDTVLGQGGKIGRQRQRLCKLCAGSMAGTARNFPTTYGASSEVMAVVCCVGNAILDELKRRA